MSAYGNAYSWAFGCKGSGGINPAMLVRKMMFSYIIFIEKFFNMWDLSKASSLPFLMKYLHWEAHPRSRKSNARRVFCSVHNAQRFLLSTSDTWLKHPYKSFAYCNRKCKLLNQMSQRQKLQALNTCALNTLNWNIFSPTWQHDRKNTPNASLKMLSPPFTTISHVLMNKVHSSRVKGASTKSWQLL